MAENTDCKPPIESEVRNEFLEENLASNLQYFELDKENGLHVLVGRNSKVKIKLLSGVAEICGAEMEQNKEYSLSKFSSVCVFTWQGCDICLSGYPEAVYNINDAAMILNVNLHASLQERRLQAEMENKRGPVIFVAGPNDIDKSSLCRSLLNYAIHMGRHPLYVDLDVGQSSNSLPGTISVLTPENPIDRFTGYHNQGVEVYQYGFRSAWQGIIFYYLLLQRVGLKLRSEKPDLKPGDQNVKTSGMIISGCDWSKCEIMHHGYDSITLVAMHFEIDIVCVLEEENLYTQLRDNMPSNVKVMFIPKLSSIHRNREVKNKWRGARIREYFYGLTNEVQPFTFEVKWSDIKVFKVWARSVPRHTHFLSDIKENEAKLNPVHLSLKLVDLVLGMSSADDFHEDIMYMPVIGFIGVVSVNLETQTISVLSLQPGPLPKKYFFLGDTRIGDCKKGVPKKDCKKGIPKKDKRKRKPKKERL